MVKTARLDDAFSEILKLEAGAVEGQSLPQKDKKRGKKEIIMFLLFSSETGNVLIL